LQLLIVELASLLTPLKVNVHLAKPIIALNVNTEETVAVKSALLISSFTKENVSTLAIPLKDYLRSHKMERKHVNTVTTIMVAKHVKLQIQTQQLVKSVTQLTLFSALNVSKIAHLRLTERLQTMKPRVHLVKMMLKLSNADQEKTPQVLMYYKQWNH